MREISLNLKKNWISSVMLSVIIISDPFCVLSILLITISDQGSHKVQGPIKV